jgi:hypothetical protein
MADNITTNDNIFVDFDCQNIILVDPNKTQNIDGSVTERKLAHENLVMYANLEARVIPRTKLAVGSAISDAIQNVPLATMNFLRPGGRTTLRNDYLDEITGLNTVNGKGTNQPSRRITQENKTDEFYISQNTLNSIDTGLLGIESIKIKNTRSATPTVDMVLVDTQGRALFEKGENSEYAAFFNLPYPIFYLTLKGFYGKAIKYQLVLTNFSAAFEGNTGNYRITLKFYSYKYTILAETQVGALFATPYMYTSDYRVSASGQEPPAVQAARASLGNNLTLSANVRTTKGQSNIRNMYAKYKRLGLISPELPELSVPELLARLELLEKNILQGFGQADFTPLSDVQNYLKLVTDFYNDVYSNNESSWFSRYIDSSQVFVFKGRKEDTAENTEPELLRTYVYKNNINTTQARLDAYVQLVQLVTNYKSALEKNPTLGLNGSFTIDNKTDNTTQIKTIQKIKINNPTNSVSNDDVLIEDTFRKAITAQEIDWEKTFELRNKRKPTNTELVQFKTENSGFFNPSAVRVGGEVATYPTYNFVFEGENNFDGLYNQLISDISKQKEKIVLALGAFLDKKIEGPNGLGFRPTIRNIMAMIFASVEAFYLMMDDVHTSAWSQRLNKKRKQAIFNSTLTSASSDTKQDTPTTNSESLADIPVYPWPQYLVDTNAEDDEPFELRYPGDRSEISRTGANDFQAWPEVEFVEEYIKGLTRTADNPPSPNGNANLSRTILRLSANGIEFPMTNIPYSDYQNVKFLYEIYERVLLASYWDRFSKGDGPGTSFELNKTLSDIENINIQTSLLGTSPSLTKILKNIAFTPVNYLDVLRSASNDGTGPSWQQLIRGEFTSDYLRAITTKDFSILPNTTISNVSDSTAQNVESYNKLSQFVKDTKSSQTDIADLYPFVYTGWTNANLANFASGQNPFNTTRSLYVNDTKRFITNYQTNFSQNDNRPFTNSDFLSVNSPNLTNSNGQTEDLNAFYGSRRLSGKLLVTEGPLTYENKTGNLGIDQTTSMLNTPIFINALNQGVDLDRNGGSLHPYVKPAYLFLNSLPLNTLRERYKNVQPTLTEDLDFMFSTLTKFGGVHKLPYAWILKYGSVWHRYKTYIETGVDILDSVWNNIDYFNLYDPTTGNLSKNYTFTNQKNLTVTITGQNNATIGGLTNSIMNLGFYPGIINNVYYFMTGQNLFSTYTNAEIDTAIVEGLNVGPINNSNIELPLGFDPNNPDRLLTLRTWFTSFDTKESSKFIPSLKNQTVVIPSFGSNTNQVYYECFSDTPTGETMTQEVFNNRAVFDGSVRTFWQAPNYGYFELPSIVKPKFDEYFKEVLPSTDNRESFKLGVEYSKIEEIFGVFKKEILDEFEQEFLKFSFSSKDASTQDVSGQSFVNKNFQFLMQELLTIDTIDNKIPYEDYVTKVSEAQAVKITNTIQTFLNYDVVFRFGNPSNFDRKLWGSFTTLPTNRVFEPFTYNAYVQNTLPSTNSAITLAQSQAAFPQAWNSMYTYVGFATTSGLEYSNSGSYYTDFFIDLNVEFTESNVQTFAPLIKIYGTQKLLANGNYGATDFTNQINTYYEGKDKFVSDILTQLFFSLQKELPNVEQSNEKPILSALDGNEQKLELWETLKAFNDKWIAGGEFQERTLFQDVLFLDRANRDIGNEVLIDVLKLKTFLTSTAQTNARIIDFVSKIFADNKFQMMPMPAYVNFWGVGEVVNGQRPRTETSQDLANSLFGTYLEVDYRESSPKLVCYFVGKPSEHLDLKENQDYRWKTDAFTFTCGGNQVLTTKLENKTDFALSNKVVGFNVDFGTRNQGVFYSIQLDQNGAAATAESNMVLTDVALQAGGKRAIGQSLGLYNYYKTRSYECRVESLGNVMIQPTMYFNLQHVPMFYGPYMIQSVEHVIDGGDFKTFFTGIRMPVASIPKITKQILSLNNNLLSELVQSVQRLKDTEAQTVSKNVIAVGNSIQSNQRFTPADPVRCISDMQLANEKYRNYLGTETVKREITFADLAKLIQNKVSSEIIRGLVFFTAYTNGHDDNKFITYDYDLGGTPFGGTVYSGITYGERRKFFTETYGCRTTSSGVSVPYAVFDNFEKSIDFISTYYSKLFNSDPEYKWNTKELFIDSLILLWIEWWPTKRFQTKQQRDNWILANTQSVQVIRAQASETVEKCISLGLINF